MGVSARLSPDAYHRLRRLLPDTGPCCLCGHRYGAKHRTVDAILGRIRAGESVVEVAADYGLDAATLRAAAEGRETLVVDMTERHAGLRYGD